jgi:uncharacterized protein
MRLWLTIFAMSAMSAGAAAAQSPIDCSVAPAVCTDGELLALESERASLVQQLTSLDPANTALASEDTWADGLSACGDDLECYRTAYLNHNQTLRQTVSALPGAVVGDVAAEAPEDAPSVEEQTATLDDVQEERLREAREAREDPGDAYVSSGLPGWGFYTALGVTFFIFWWLMRAMGRHRREVRAESERY